MRRPPFASFAVAAGLVLAATAFAQAPSPSATPAPGATPAQPATNGQPENGADDGFFRPQPGDDPSLFHTLPPEAYRPPASASPATPPGAAPARTRGSASSSAPAPVVVVVPDSYAAARSREIEADRAQIEALRAHEQALPQPAPINGSFTGLTDERYR